MPPLLDHNELFVLKRFAQGWTITGQRWRRNSISEEVLLHDMRRAEALIEKGMVAITSDPDCKPVCYEITEAGVAAIKL